MKKKPLTFDLHLYYTLLSKIELFLILAKQIVSKDIREIKTSIK